MRKNGFTLLEMLFVLGILSILLFISIPLNIATLEKQQIEQFFNTFESDVLYIQSTTTSSNKPVKIRFMEDRYKIRQSNHAPLAIRNYPEGLKMDWRKKPYLVFNETGTVINPRTIKVTTKQGTYNIVFPLGKGRCYIVKI